MSDDPDLRDYVTQEKLIEIKEEFEKILKENEQLKQQMAFNNFINIVDGIQSKFDVISNSLKKMQNDFTVLSDRVSTNEKVLSEIKEALSEKNLSIHTDSLIKPNDPTQVLETNDNNFEKETILLLGGFDGKKGDSLLILEQNKENWKELTIKLPLAVRNHGAQFLNNNLYIFGGQNEKWEIMNCIYKLSNKLQWQKMADMNEKRYGISNSNVILHDHIWVLGGGSDNNRLKSVERYNPEINQWEYVRDMNACRQDAAAAVINEKIFCCGGSDGDTYLNSVECYDPFSDTWTLICYLPRVSAGCGAVAINDKLIIIGGWTGWEHLRTVWILDTTDENGKWTDKPQMALSCSFFSIAKSDSKVFICGGFHIDKKDSKSKSIDDVKIFDGKIWKNGPKLKTPRRNAPAVAIPIDFFQNI